MSKSFGKDLNGIFVHDVLILDSVFCHVMLVHGDFFVELFKYLALSSSRSESRCGGEAFCKVDALRYGLWQKKK